MKSPAKIETKSDQDLLTRAGDIIDNAVFDAIVATVTKDPCLKSETLYALISLTHQPDKNLHLHDNDILEKAITIVKDNLKSANIKPGQTPNWDMSIIGPTTDALENLLIEHHIPTCHPWEDEDETICYLSDDRCPHCQKHKAAS